MDGLRAGAILKFQSSMFGPGKKEHKQQKNQIRGVEFSEKICSEGGGIYDLIARASSFIRVDLETAINFIDGHELFGTHQVRKLDGVNDWNQQN